MNESYKKGIASHLDPESILDDPQMRTEALTGESAGGLLSSESTLFREPRRWPGIEGNMDGRVIRERLSARRSQRTWHAWTLSAREPRDLGKEPAWG